MSVCVSSFYFPGVFLATFLGDLTQNWTSLVAVVFLRWISTGVPMPSLDVFRATPPPRRSDDGTKTENASRGTLQTYLARPLKPWASMSIL